MQLIKVSVTLDKIEKPLDPPWRMYVAWAFLAAALAAPVALYRLGVSGNALVIPVFAGVLAAAYCRAYPFPFLPAVARRFRAATREELRDLVRRTEAFNRAWCLAERHDRHGNADAFQAKYRKLRMEVDAYARRYRHAVDSDLSKDAGTVDRRAVRQEIVDRSKDLVELEAKLDELGEDSDPGMRTHARAMRETLEKDCVKAGLPLGIVRLRRAATKPPPLPTAKIVSEGRS